MTFYFEMTWGYMNNVLQRETSDWSDFTQAFDHARAMLNNHHAGENLDIYQVVGYRKIYLGSCQAS